MFLENMASHFSTMLEPVATASFLSSLSIIHDWPNVTGYLNRPVLNSPKARGLPRWGVEFRTGIGALKIIGFLPRKQKKVRKMLFKQRQPKSPNLFPLYTLYETFIKRAPLLSGRRHRKTIPEVGDFYCCRPVLNGHLQLNSTAQDARYHGQEDLTLAI